MPCRRRRGVETGHEDSDLIDLKQFRMVTARGVFGLMEALGTWGSNDRLRPLMRRTWGPYPALALGLLAIAAGLIGVLLGGLIPEGWPVSRAIGPVLLLSAIAAGRIRSVLRQDLDEVMATPARSFRAFALPLVPMAAVLIIVTTLAPFVLPVSWPGASATAFTEKKDALAIVLAVLVSWLAHGAGLAACIATFVGRRWWLGSLVEIAWRYVIFRLLLLGSQFAIGIMSGLLWGFARQLLASFTGWQLPAAWRAVIDQLLDRGVAGLVFLALIGGAWVAAEQCFPRLLRTGDVHFLRAFAGLFNDQKKPPRERPDPNWPDIVDPGRASAPPQG